MKSVTELWAPVLINNGIFKANYLVSNMGRVKEKRVYKKGSSQFVLMNIIDSKRPVVKMKGGGRTYIKSVAKLVLSSFQYREGCECANITYLDGDMKNCRLSNLMYTADKTVFTAIELENMMAKARKAAKPESKIKTKRDLERKKKTTAPVPVQKKCVSCRNYPCFEGLDNMSSDFARCKSYKPIQ